MQTTYTIDFMRLAEPPLALIKQPGIQRPDQARVRARSGAGHFRSSPSAYSRDAAPQRARCQPARRADASWAQELGNNGTLHARRFRTASLIGRKPPAALLAFLLSFPMSQVRQKAERVGEIAAKAIVQLLFSTGKSFTVDGLREKLRELRVQNSGGKLQRQA
jgi:hypothetical protein